MATVYSDQRTNDLAAPPVPNNANTHGRVKRVYFSLNTTTTPLNINDVAELCKVPVKARLQGIFFAHEAMGAGALAAIGVSGAAGKYATGLDVAAIGTKSGANTIALNFGEELAAESTLLLTATGANYATAKLVKGYVEYISAGE